MIEYYDLSKASVTRWGKSVLFEEPGRYPILSLHGSFYEKGFAIGKLLHKRLHDLLAYFITTASALLGGWEPDGHTIPAAEQIRAGRSLISQHIEKDLMPAVSEQYPQFLEMIQGELDGLRDCGLEMEMNDLLTLNMVSESYFWTHGCSSFSAWGSATVDGELIHAMNLDQESYGMLHENIVLMAEENDNGFDVLGPTYLGCVFAATFLNSAGLSYGEMTSVSPLDEWPMMPHYCQAKLIATTCDTTAKAVDVTRQTGGTTGWVNLFSQCSPEQGAVAIETVGRLVGVRKPVEPISDMIFATNHFRAFPGWNGYEGPNLMEAQFNIYRSDPGTKIYFSRPDLTWEDADSPEKWEKVFHCPRYDRYLEFLTENRGRLDIKHAIEIQTFPPLGMGNVELPPAPAVCDEFQQLYGRIGAVYMKSLRSVYSCVMKPSRGEIWLATGKAPAQAAPYTKVNLKDIFDKTASLR